MYDPLFEYYRIRFEILALILAGIAVAAVYLGLRRRWQSQQKALKHELAECQSVHFEKLHNDLQRSVAHEYSKGLDYILNKSSETLEGLRKEQTVLRDKQDGIIAKAQDLKQHAMNILYVFAPQPGKLRKELLNIRQLIESVLLELYPYAESQGVTLRPSLDDIEPFILDRDLTGLAIRNLVHNAIKYSESGRMVEIRLTCTENTTRLGKAVVITVIDRGRGILESDKEKLFELNQRGDGLIETGNGLGLYCTRMATRLQGGDVILVSSSPGQGSVFEIRLPFASAGEVVQETEAESHQRTQAAWRWGAATGGLLVLAAVLFLLFKPPQKVALVTEHVDYGIRYVTALDDGDGWLLTQEPDLGACGWFTRLDLGKDDQGHEKVALRTCYGRYITAPWKANENLVSSAHDLQWRLWQDSAIGDCGQFVVLPLAEGKFAFQTCTGMLITPGDGGWPGEMAWAVVAETDKVKDWEKFTLQLQH